MLGSFGVVRLLHCLPVSLRRHHCCIHSVPRAGGWKRRIATEAAGLRDLAIAWGSSILTRSDESSLDLMQACIVGPRDTPYANALLFFDLSIPSDYPQTNPKCKITSTGGGAVRFNANLYADGKVRVPGALLWQDPLQFVEQG